MMIFENICKSYGENRVIRNFSYSLKKGRRLAICGESGFGKTTLLRIIAGIEAPDSGIISGYEFSQTSFMFQEPRLFEWYDALNNLMLASSLPKKDARAKATGLLKSMGLIDSAHQKPGELSGGMKQRLSLARAFMPEKDIIILDEPFSALDDENRCKMRKLVSRLTQGKTLIYVTHDKEDLELADEIIAPDENGIFVPIGRRVLGDFAG